MKQRRSVRAVASAGVAISVLALAGCTGGGSGSGGSSPSGGSSGKATVTFWVRAKNGAEGIAKSFNASQSKVQVQVTTIPDSEYVTKLGAAVRGRSGPDVADIDDINAPLVAATGIAADITSYVKKLPFYRALSPAQLNLSTLHGKYYGVPFINGSSILMYNKGLFKKAGLDPNKPPTNWAQIEQYAKKITALGNGIHGYDIPGACGGCSVYTIYPLIWASGGQVFSGFGPNQKTTYSQGGKTAAALTFLHKLWAEGVVAPCDKSQNGSTWGTDFQSGKLGMIVGTPVWIPAAEKNGVKVGTATIPGQNGGYSTFVGGDSLIALQSSQHLDAVEKFITYALSKKAQTTLASDWALGPVRSDMLTPAFQAKYPATAVVIKSAEKGDVPKVIGFTAATEDPNAPWVSAVQKIVFGGANATVTLKAADKASAPLIHDAYQQQVGQ